jgi:hypothetical protein
MRPLVMLGVAACWIGAALLLAAVVAPAAFAVLPSRAVAGAVVGRILPAIFVAGLVGASATVLLDLAGPRLSGASGRLVLGVIWAASCALAQFVVAGRISRIRGTIGPSVDALTVDDARRIAFGRLHGASVGLLTLAIVAAMGIAVLASVAARPRP